MTDNEAPTPDVVIGRYGLRTFRVSADGYLLPAMRGFSPYSKTGTWRGRNMSRCLRSGA